MMNHSSKTANTNSGAMIVEWPSSQQRRQQSPPPRNSHRQKGETEKSRSKRKGTVNFSHATRVEFVRGLWDYTEEELVATYYTDEEYALIKKSMRATVKAMRKARARKIDLESLITDSEEYSTRGLEHLASSAELERRARKRDQVVSEVLNEQNRQRQVESPNVYTIAAASSICSKWSRDVSLREAVLDETQAKAHQEVGGVLTAGAVSPTLGCSDVARQGQGHAGCVRAGRRDSSTRTSSASSGVAKLQTALEHTLLDESRKGSRGEDGPKGQIKISGAKGPLIEKGAQLAQTRMRKYLRNDDIPLRALRGPGHQRL